ncbi:hypothetical protein [Gemmatimonas sp.]|jgi:hypothetical protein|uniref:hypothetical protein n=1 Tax=Gemmatimonas sp. TaxID=1962908 RepID=UPI0022BE69C8|nr:hypothetical protein [Gemmatimonas sp.]MCZ8204542.1 hypothetical protein [Gemmatimonas sp.]
MPGARRAAAAALVLVSATHAGVRELGAQTTAGNCATATFGGFSGEDACVKARDLFAFVMPQVGVALSGGNPVLGEGGTLGGWGKRALSLRVTAVDGRVPAKAVPIRLTGPASSNFGASRVPVPVPSVDAAIGLFTGVPAGLTNIGGVDLLLGATYLPNVTKNGFSVAPQTSSVALSYGVRVGALQESWLVPGVSVSYMRRRLPTTSLGYTAGNDSITVRNLAATSNSLRVVVSKRVTIFGFAAGVGRDQIENTAGMEAVVNETVLNQQTRALVSLFGLRNTVTRKSAFANVSLGLGLARLVAEFGWSGAGDADPTTNTFGGRAANEGYRFGSLGLTVRF